MFKSNIVKWKRINTDNLDLSSEEIMTSCEKDM